MPFWHIAHLKASNIMASVTLEHSLTGSREQSEGLVDGPEH